MSSVGRSDITTPVGLGGKYLTFDLANEEYGLPILTVREIIGVLKITPVPNTPEFVEGVVNLRGKIIPVLDLRSRFGMEKTERTKETCIIVVQSADCDRGILVDRVSEVIDILDEQVETPPQFGDGIEAELIRGIGKSADQVTLLLDTEKALDIRDGARAFGNPHPAESKTDVEDDS